MILFEQYIKFWTYNLIKTLDILVFNNKHNKITPIKCIQDITYNPKVDIYHCITCDKYFNNDIKFNDDTYTINISINIDTTLEEQINNNFSIIKNPYTNCYNEYKQYVESLIKSPIIKDKTSFELMGVNTRYYKHKLNKFIDSYNIPNPENKLIVDCHRKVLSLSINDTHSSLGSIYGENKLNYSNNVLSIFSYHTSGNNFEFYKDKRLIRKITLSPSKIKEYILTTKYRNEIFYIQQNMLQSVKLDDNFKREIIGNIITTYRHDIDNIDNIGNIIYNEYTDEIIIHCDNNMLVYMNENGETKRYKYHIGFDTKIFPIRFTNLLYAYNGSNNCIYLIDDKWYNKLFKLNEYYNFNTPSLTTDYYNNILYFDNDSICISNNYYNTPTKYIKQQKKPSSNLISGENELIYVDINGKINYITFDR